MRPLADRKAELLHKTQQRSFHQDAANRSATFDEIHKLDQFLNEWNGLGKALESLQNRLQERLTTKSEEAALHAKIEQLAAELDQLCFIAASKNVRDLGDALVCISLVDRSGETRGGVEKLVGMYQALARRRRLTAEVLGEYCEGKKDYVYLRVSGLGCYSLLKNESGLHQLDRRFKAKATRNRRELIQEDREVLRVEVLPLDCEPDKAFRHAVKYECNDLKPVHNRLMRSDTAVTLFHEPTLRSLSLWTTGPRDSALDRAFVILHGQVSTGAARNESCANEIIRHYELGLSPRIKDARTGRSTSNVERILKGHLDSLLLGA